MTTNPCFEALPLELKLKVFQYLNGDLETLYSVIQVNKAWCNYGIHLLWRDVDARNLVAIPVADRQVHANDIESLWIYGAQITFDLASLAFPSLKQIHLHGDGRHSEARARPFLLPSLEVLDIDDWMFTPNLLDLAQILAPNIQHLRFHQSPARFDTQVWAQFISSFRHLKGLDLDNFTYRHFSEDIFAALPDSLASQLEQLTLNVDPRDVYVFCEFLSRCSALKSLDISSNSDELLMDEWMIADFLTSTALETLRFSDCTWVREKFTDDVLKIVDEMPLLPRIRSLSLQGSTSPVSSLLSHMGFRDTLSKLELSIDETSLPLCETIGSLTSLTDLRLVFEVEKQNFVPGIHALSNLIKLQRLELIENNVKSSQQWRSQDALKVSWINDDDFAHCVSKFSRLRELVFHVNCRMFTTAAIRSLGSSCPSLTTCTLGYTHNLQAWGHIAGPLFPALKTLTLGGIYSFNNDFDVEDEAEQYVDTLKRLAPRLKDFHTAANTPCAHHLNDLFAL